MTEAIPTQVLDIAARLGRNEKVNRRTIETLLKWFSATKRGKGVVTKIRQALLSAGLETDPDFTQGGVGDSIAFSLIGESRKAASPTSGADSSEPPQTEPAVEDADTETVQSGGHADKASDDNLEPEDDDEQQAADDDRPVVSKPADWTITSLREKWEGGLLQLQPSFQREYVWRLKPELPSRLIESVLLEIPIPPLYFGRLGGGKLEVIDEKAYPVDLGAAICSF